MALLFSVNDVVDERRKMRELLEQDADEDEEQDA
jgi:hypothetical protein